MNKDKKSAIFNKIQEFFSSNDIEAEVVDKTADVELSKEERITRLNEVHLEKSKEVDFKFETVLLNDGETEVTIEPAIEVGAAIVLTAEDGTPVAAPAGNYELQDGRVLMVEEDGVIAAITEPSEETPEEGLSDDKPSNSEKVKREIERIEREKIFSRLEDIEKKLEESEEKVKFLQKEAEEKTEAFNNLKKFTKETFETLLAEPSKEPVADKKNPMREFRKDFGQNKNPLQGWMDKHN